MSSNAVAAIAVILVSGFAGCAATAKSAEPVAIAAAEISAAPTTARFTAAAPSRITAPAPTRTVTIAPDGRAVYR